MAKKYYAVKVGKAPGVYDTWGECQAQINGFSGAVFKGFPTRKEAEAFVKGSAGAAKKEETEAVAYVDGSYDSVSHSFSYGMVLFHKGEEQHFSEKFTGSNLAEMRNVAGEIKGAEAAMRYCVEKGISSVTIYHDYEGIAKWCNGDWQAKKDGTKAYAAYYKEAAAKVHIQFEKVKGHSGDVYNDMADQLAKKALGLA